MVETLQRSLEARLSSIEDNVDSDGGQNEDDEIETISAKRKDKESTKNIRKKGSNHKKNADNEPSSVIYLGHLPVGFEEREITVFLNQFGNVMRCRVSRSKKTGRSRGYAFVEFVDRDVAKIVAETMSGYFLLEKRLVCHMLPQDQVHDLMFAKAKRIPTKTDIHKKARLEVNKQRSVDALKGITAKLVKREEMKRKKLAALGFDYEFPGYAAGAKSMDDSEPSSKRQRKLTPGDTDDNEDAELEKKTPKSSKKKKSKNAKVESEKENVTNSSKDNKEQSSEGETGVASANARRSTSNKKTKKAPKK